MPTVRTAKLFRNGGSQAVRLPAEFRFDGDEVYVTRDDRTGDLVLSERPPLRTIRDYYERVGYLEEEVEFMNDRPLNRVWTIRNPFLEEEIEGEVDS